MSGSTSILSEPVAAWLQQWPRILRQVEEFCTDLKRRKIRGSSGVARVTAEIFRNLVGTCVLRSTTVAQFITNVRLVARELMAAEPSEVAIGNVARRVLHIIRDELAKRGGREAFGALHSLLVAEESPKADTLMAELKVPVIERLSEFVDELGLLASSIMEHAHEHIHDNDVILTYGVSRTIEFFMKAAAGRRTKRKARAFEVLVCESAPQFTGQEMAKSLAAAGIATTVIADTAIFAVMPRVTKVLISAHAIMANGGVIAPNGCHMLALAAKHHAIPMICVSGLHKLSPVFPFGQDTVNDILSPSAVLPFEELEAPDKVKVVNPAYDYVPPELVDLFVTDVGGAQPSYIYRLLAENYSREDYDLH